MPEIYESKDKFYIGRYKKTLFNLFTTYLSFRKYCAHTKKWQSNSIITFYFVIFKFWTYDSSILGRRNDPITPPIDPRCANQAILECLEVVLADYITFRGWAQNLGPFLGPRSGKNRQKYVKSTSSQAPEKCQFEDLWLKLNFLDSLLYWLSKLGSFLFLSALEVEFCLFM